METQNPTIRIQYRPDKGPQADKPLDDKTHQNLLEYLLDRVRTDKNYRNVRCSRYAAIDRMISTWQRLTKQDSVRAHREEQTGKLQALPMNLPLAQAHVEDLTAFFSEVFAPLGGNFYANPGKKEENPQINALVDIMNQDAQRRKYYKNVAMTMRRLLKYNIGGFHVQWEEGAKNHVGDAAVAGNKCESVDMYNVFWDPVIKDPSQIHLNAEWVAMCRPVSQLWLIRQAMAGNLSRIEQVLEQKSSDNESRNSYGGTAEFYRYPPHQAGMGNQGQDDTTAEDSQDTGAVDWQSWGLSMDSETAVIQGHELMVMYAWVNPDQFGLSDTDGDDTDEPADGSENQQRIELWKFMIINSKNIVSMDKVDDADDVPEIPTYFCQMSQDDLQQAARSLAELVRPFQRFTSFLLNTHVEGVRSNIWGITAIDPAMFDPANLKNGETSAVMVSKVPGRDVRSGMMKMQSQTDTRTNLQDTDAVLGLMKQFFPNQALPSQVAGMDRAVTSQVQAVMQGSMRKMQMIARVIDSDMMLPMRLAQYRNVASNDVMAQQLVGITEDQVAALLGSGLGQILREAAATQLRDLIFALLQNPQAAAQYDMAGLFSLYSSLLNIGTDLGDFYRAPTQTPQDAQAARQAAGGGGNPSQGTQGGQSQ